MQATTHEQVNQQAAGNTGGFLAGMLIGGLAAAGTALLLAPQPGDRTRAELRLRGGELRDQTVKSLGTTISEARTKAGVIAAAARERIEQFRRRGQEIIEEQPARLSAEFDQLSAG